ncbi:hypothetical protein BH24ACI2_BH24ACI2_13770 [soil metagenome]|jgi:ketosteroid isomerase-like protein|nr:DUF3225 domain-containing protein [Acidobacteriota bacterium]
MRNFVLVILLVLICSFAAFGQKAKTDPAAAKATATADDEKAVRNAFDDLIRAIENSNVDGATQAYWNSPELLFFNHNGTVTRGWEQNRKNREATYPRIKNVKLEKSDVRVMMLGKDAALVTFLWKQTRDYDNSSESASGRTTLVYKKTGKDWKVVHLHSSPDNAPVNRPVFPSEREPVSNN